MPIYAVPKPHSEKLRLVNHQSYGPFALNSMIKREDICENPLDNLWDLGADLLAFRSEHGYEVKLRMYKTDISRAFRNLPSHVLWQIKQIVKVDIAE